MLPAKKEVRFVLVALYRYLNIPFRIMYPLLNGMEGVKADVIFFKHAEANIGEPPTQKEEELLIEQIKSLNPDLVGFSVMSPYFFMAKKLTRLVKKHLSVPVAWGGTHATIAPHTCIPEADIVCVGEGEGAVSDLATCLRDGKDYSNIQNLWVKKENGEVIKNPMRPLEQNLDTFPIVKYAHDTFYFIDENKVTREDPLLQTSMLGIQASRGCPYVCSFCVNAILRPLMTGLGKFTRRRSIPHLIKEIKQNSTPITDYIYFLDEVFGVKDEWLDEFEELYKKEIGLPFAIEYHPAMVADDMLDKLANAGLHMLKIGIQANSDHIRNQIFQRPGKASDIIGVAKKIHAHGVIIRYDLILDNPYDDEASLKNGIETILQLPRPRTFNLYAMQYYPFYPFTDKALEDKLVQDEKTTMENLYESNLHNWSYVPKLRPYDRKRILQNMIWMLVWDHASDERIRYIVFHDSLPAKILLHTMNIKSLVLGRIFGLGGLIAKHRWMQYCLHGVRLVKEGNFKGLYQKLRKVAKIEAQVRETIRLRKELLLDRN